MTGNSIDSANNVAVNKITGQNPTSRTSTSASTESTSLFGAKYANKKQLTPEVINYIKSKGLDPENLTDTQLAACITEYNAQKDETAAASAKDSETPQSTAPQSAESTAETTIVDRQQAPDPTTATTPTAPVAAAVTENAPKQEPSTVNTKSTDPKAKEEAKENAASSKNVEVKVDYEKGENKYLHIEVAGLCEGEEPNDKNIKPEDKEFFEKFVKAGGNNEDVASAYKNNILLKTLTMAQIGEDKWAEMSFEDQCKAMESVNKNLTEACPSWSKLNSNDKLQLAKAFYQGQLEEKTYNRDYNLSLDKQIETVAKNVIAERHEQEEYVKQKNEFVGAINDFAAKKDNYSGTAYYTYGDKLWQLQYDYLNDKIKNGGELTAYEKQEYEALKIADKGTGGDLSKLGENTQDEVHSTLQTMKKSPVYREAKSNLSAENSETAIQTAEEQWLATQFKDLPENPTEQDKIDKFMELLNNCSGASEKVELGKIASRLAEKNPEWKTLGQYKNETLAVVGTVSAIQSGDAGEQIAHGEKISEAYKEGCIGESCVINNRETQKEYGKKEATNKVFITYNKVSEKAMDAYLDESAKGEISVDDQQEAVDDMEANYDDYSANSRKVYGKNAGKLDDSIEVDSANRIKAKAVEKGDADFVKALGSGVHTFNVDNQTVMAESIMESSYSFGKKDGIDIQNSIADSVLQCDKSVQAKIHDTLMSSKYEEVLEHASSNIYKYDESAQAEAIKSSYKTGNQKAIDAVNSQIESCSQKAVAEASKEFDIKSSKAESESRSTKNGSEAYAKAVIDNNKITQNLTEPETIKGLTETEKTAYYVEYFMKTTDNGRYNILSKLSDSQLKEVISKLCKYNSSMIKGLVAQGLGKYVLQTLGKSPDVLYSTLNIMFQKGSKDAKYAANYIMTNKSLIHFSDNMIERAEEILGKDNIKVRATHAGDDKKSESGEDTIQYTSNPYGFMKSSLQPRLSSLYPNKKEMFYNA